MKFITVSDELLEILEPYSDWFFQQDLEPLNKLSYDNPKHEPKYQLGWSTSDNYLKQIVAKDGEHEGYPEQSYSYDLQIESSDAQNFKDKYRDLWLELGAWLGARNLAVHVYYPKGGYMGWHNNWNAHGYNILISYSENGRGFFKYRDPKTHEVKHLQDPAGWSCKVGYYGRGREPDKVYYHCAGTSEPRITFGFVIPDEGMWQNMIDDIAGQ